MLKNDNKVSRRGFIGIAVPAVAAAAVAGAGGYYAGSLSAKPNALVIDGRVGLSALVSLVEGHIGTMMGTMEVLALTDEVKSASWGSMENLLGKFNEGQAPSVPSLAWFALPDGSYYAVGLGLTDKNIADRPYFPKVMSGETTLGDLVISRATGKKSVVAAVPAKNQGKVIGALGVSIYLDSFSGVIVEELRLPENMVFYAINEEGSTSLHSNVKYLLEEPDKQRSETLSQAVRRMMSAEEGQVTYQFEGYTKEVLFRRSTQTGWRIALGVMSK